MENAIHATLFWRNRHSGLASRSIGPSSGPLSGRTGEIFGFATLALRRSRARRVARRQSRRGAKPKSMPTFIAGPLRGVHDPNGFAVQKGLRVLNALRIETAPGLSDPVAEMRRKNGTARSSQRMVRRQRLLIVHVERRDDLAGLDRGDKSGFVDERASRGVDEDSALF